MRTSFYFAHPVTMYDTSVERTLQRRFQAQQPDTAVENPNQPQHTVGYQQGGMDYFVSLCDKQDGVFFAPFANGELGAGVAREVESFLRRGAPAYQYVPQTHSFAPASAQDVAAMPVMSVEDTRARLKLERQQAAEGHNPYDSLGSYEKGLNLIA